MVRPRLLGTNFLNVKRHISLLPWNYCLNLKLLFVFRDMLCLSQADTLNFHLLYTYCDFSHAITLMAGRSDDRILVGARFSTTLQTDPWAHPASSNNGYRVSFPRIKGPGRNVNHPPTSSAEVKERVELCLYCPPVPLNPVLGRTLPSLPHITLMKFLIPSVGTCS